VKTVGILALMVAFAAPMVAQTPRPLNELTEELKKLEFLMGDWSAEGSVYPAEGEKETWSGTARGRWVLRGRHLRLDTTVTTKAGTTESSAMLTWDPHRERYHALLFSSTEPTPRFVAGTFDGKKLSLQGPRGDAETKLSMVFEKSSDDEYTLNVDMVREESTVHMADGKYMRKRHGGLSLRRDVPYTGFEEERYESIR